MRCYLSSKLPAAPALIAKSNSCRYLTPNYPSFDCLLVIHTSYSVTWLRRSRFTPRREPKPSSIPDDYHKDTKFQPWPFSVKTLNYLRDSYFFNDIPVLSDYRNFVRTSIKNAIGNRLVCK
jgi:hypothetical protein